jgi:DNA-binding FrmR family transcriptional regulator
VTTSEPAAACATPMMSEERVADARRRLARINGQVTGVARMVEEGRYCVDVLHQIAAVQQALDSVAQLVTRNYLERCVTDAITSGDPLIYDELMKVIYAHRPSTLARGRTK